MVAVFAVKHLVFKESNHCGKPRIEIAWYHGTGMEIRGADCELLVSAYLVSPLKVMFSIELLYIIFPAKR